GGFVDLAFAERVDQILGGDQPSRPRAIRKGEAHAGVRGVVFGVHDAVPVAVVGAAAGGVRVLGVGELPDVEVDLQAQVALAPVDAVVEDRDPRVGAPALGLPGAGGVE